MQFSLHLLSEERQEGSDDDIVAMLAEVRCISRNEQATRRNHAGPDSSVEFGMAFEQRSVKAEGEGISGLRLLSAIFGSLPLRRAAPRSHGRDNRVTYTPAGSTQHCIVRGHSRGRSPCIQYSWHT